MTIEMQETIKKETNRCPHDLAYLATGTSGNQPKCKINYSGGRNVLYLLHPMDIFRVHIELSLETELYVPAQFIIIFVTQRGNNLIAIQCCKISQGRNRTQ